MQTFKWKSDLCGCVSTYYFNETDTVVGELIQPCEFHNNFDETLISNRLKNASIEAINEIIDPTDKRIDFKFDTGEITLLLYGYDGAEIEIIDQMNLDVNIEEIGE